MNNSEAIEAELAIRSCIGRLAHLADYGDLDEYLDMYTPEAMWQRPHRDECFSGVDEIRAITVHRRASGIQGPGVDSGHCNTSLWIDLHDDGVTATAHSYNIFVVSTRSTPTVKSSTRYEDTFVRTEHGWKLANRIVHEH